MQWTKCMIQEHHQQQALIDKLQLFKLSVINLTQIYPFFWTYPYDHQK